MTYHPYKRSRAALGGVGDVADAAVRVVTDPCLTQVAGLVLRLNKLEQPSSSSGGPPSPPVKGIGLCKAVPAIKGIVWVRERPWVLPVGAFAIVGGLIALGYAMGRDRRKGTS
jgi:hypothetical protein